MAVTGGLTGPVPELELIAFRDPPAVAERTVVFTDASLGGYSVAALDAEPLAVAAAGAAPPPGTCCARFHGSISIELPPNNPEVERSGFAAWRTKPPGWTLFGRAAWNCEALDFLALRVKADRSHYFVNLQTDSVVATDLYQHRLFARAPGSWETVYLPFADFVKTHEGRMLRNQEPIPKANLTTVGLGLIDRIPGPFELRIDRIWVRPSPPERTADARRGRAYMHTGNQ